MACYKASHEVSVIVSFWVSHLLFKPTRKWKVYLQVKALLYITEKLFRILTAVAAGYFSYGALHFEVDQTALGRIKYGSRRKLSRIRLNNPTHVHFESLETLTQPGESLIGINGDLKFMTAVRYRFWERIREYVTRFSGCNQFRGLKTFYCKLRMEVQGQVSHCFQFLLLFNKNKMVLKERCAGAWRSWLKENLITLPFVVQVPGLPKLLQHYDRLLNNCETWNK